MLKKRLYNRLLKKYFSPYRNLWFLIKKKNSKYKLINIIININKITIRDANLLLSIEEFSK